LLCQTQFAFSYLVHHLLSRFFSVSLREGNVLANPDDNINVIKIVYEVISVFGATGLSMGFSQGVSSLATIPEPSSKILLIVTMLVG
jgi:Trk-type K+ transport system membrane component